MLIHFDTIPERDRHTNRWTDGQTDIQTKVDNILPL